MPISLKARLKPTRCASRSVSTSTPSQSKISAFSIPPGPSGGLGEEARRHVLAAELLDEAGEHRLARLILRIDQPQGLEVPGLGGVVVDEALHEHVLEVGR